MASIRPSPGGKGDIAFRRLSRRTVPPVLLFFAAAAAVLALTWPWILHWRGEFFAHWDPPFHAWKLESMARRILAGDVFLSSGNSNVFHPYSGTLYYEVLQYPPALFAAVLFGLTPMPSELVYHVTLLVFWALSAPCMYFLLRTLACSRPAATFGSMAFCILPWRVSFAAEFQMQLVFAMPLVFAFLVRFLRDGRAADAVLCAFVVAARGVGTLRSGVRRDGPSVRRGRIRGTGPPDAARETFWTGAAAGTAVAAGSLFLLLRPYLVLRAEGNVVRPLSEISAHAVQPLSYLVPYGRFSFWDVPAWEDEFSVYPTLAVAGLLAELPERTVVEFPFGFEWRWSDAMRKFSLVKGDWPCAFAWGGFCPPWQARLEETWSRRAFRKMHGELSKLYPDALLLADLRPAKEEPASGDPDRAAFRPGQWRGKRTKPDFLPALSSIATPRTGDGRFVWMELKPPVPGRIREKVFRTDLLRRRPVCEAAVRTSPGASVEARFNGVSAAVSTADASGVASFRFAPALHAPPERTKPNSVTFSAGAVPCTIISFALVPETAPVSGGNR